MADILANIKNNLNEKGFIEQNLLAWGRKKTTSFINHQMFFFGIKNKELMILPIIDFNNFLFNEIEYFTKANIKDIKFSGLTSILQIAFNNGNSIKYSIMQNKSDIQKIVATVNT
jgi:hypothetical protein